MSPTLERMDDRVVPATFGTYTFGNLAAPLAFNRLNFTNNFRFGAANPLLNGGFSALNTRLGGLSGFNTGTALGGRSLALNLTPFNGTGLSSFNNSLLVPTFSSAATANSLLAAEAARFGRVFIPRPVGGLANGFLPSGSFLGGTGLLPTGNVPFTTTLGSFNGGSTLLGSLATPSALGSFGTGTTGANLLGTGATGLYTGTNLTSGTNLLGVNNSLFGPFNSTSATGLGTVPFGYGTTTGLGSPTVNSLFGSVIGPTPFQLAFGNGVNTFANTSSNFTTLGAGGPFMTSLGGITGLTGGGTGITLI